MNYIQGMLNEEVTLTKGVATSLNEMFQNNDHIDIDLIESLIKILLIVVTMQHIHFSI